MPRANRRSETLRSRHKADRNLATLPAHPDGSTYLAPAARVVRWQFDRLPGHPLAAGMSVCRVPEGYQAAGELRRNWLPRNEGYQAFPPITHPTRQARLATGRSRPITRATRQRGQHPEMPRTRRGSGLSVWSNCWRAGVGDGWERGGCGCDVQSRLETSISGCSRRPRSQRLRLRRPRTADVPGHEHHQSDGDRQPQGGPGVPWAVLPGDTVAIAPNPDGCQSRPWIATTESGEVLAEMPELASATTGPFVA